MSQIFDKSIEVVNFPNELKYADIIPVCKKKIIDTKKRIVDLLILYLSYPKYSKIVVMMKSV